MSLRTDEVFDLVRAVSDYWHQNIQPEVLPNACILASRYASELLTYFGVENSVIPVAVVACNDPMLEFLTTTDGVPPFPDGAWSVGVGVPNAKAEIYPKGDGWNGHAVVITRSFYVDLTAPQMDRPKYNIVSGGSLIAEIAEMRTSPLIDGWNYIQLPQGHYSWRQTNDAKYKDSKDWNSTYRLFTGNAIRSIRKDFGQLLTNHQTREQ